MIPPLRRIPAALLAAAVAAAAAGCKSPPELEGAAAARSRGAAVEARPDAAGGGTSAPVDPWLDDARVLARVNGKIITLREVRHAMGPAYDQGLNQRDELAAYVAARVRDLVIRRLVVEEAKRIGFASSDEDRVG